MYYCRVVHVLLYIPMKTEGGGGTDFWLPVVAAVGVANNIFSKGSACISCFIHALLDGEMLSVGESTFWY